MNTKDCRSRHQHVTSRFSDGPRRRGADPAIHLHSRLSAHRPPHRRTPLHRFLNERLTAEARKDAHHQDQVKQRKARPVQIDLPIGIQGQPRRAAKRPDPLDHRRALAHGHHLSVHRQVVSPSVGKGLHQLRGLLDHQVHIKPRLGQPVPQRSDHRWPHRQVGNEVPVHHVDVQPISAQRKHLLALSAQLGKVRGQDGGQHHRQPGWIGKVQSWHRASVQPRLYHRHMPTIEDIRARLEAVQQAHLLAFADSLDASQLDQLLTQIDAAEPETFPSLVETYVKNKPLADLPAGVEPAPYYALQGDWDRAAAQAAGEQLLKAGKVACFTVAGGQGSRLGYDGPKGCYPSAPISRKPLFQVFAESIRKASSLFGKPIPWAIMTSDLNHEATVSFFEQHNHFGLNPADVVFFPQGAMPAFDRTSGNVLLAAKDALALTPDGHGGSIRALHRSGTLDALRARGIEHLSYFQVDNATVKPVDPVFLGLHVAAPDSSGEMSSKMVAKAYAEEKVGLFCKIDGRTAVVEYSDMPMERQQETNLDGSLKFNGGSIAIHAMSLDFLSRVATNPQYALPFHRADKKVPYCDPQSGKIVQPDEPNAVKLEMFVFDALPLAEKSIVLETDRVEEFAPIKNAEGNDSPATSTALQTERAARWLEARGVAIPRSSDGAPACTIEISPLTATDPSHLEGMDLPEEIESGSEVVL